MRVLFIAFRDFENPSSVGGDYYLWELAKGLFQLGHKVTFLCSGFEGSKRIDVIDGVEIVRIKGTWSLPLQFFKRYLERMKGNFDIVVEEAIGGRRFPFLCTVYVKEPLVAVWHQRHYRIFREEYPLPMAVLLSWLELFQARLYRNRTIITPSKGAKEKLAPLGFKSDRVKVVYDGVGGIFCKGEAHQNRQNIIVYLGKLRKYKRTDHAILAFAHALKSVAPTYRLIIAGKVSEIDRNYVDQLRKIAKSLGVQNKVEFRLNISEIEKRKLLERARLLIQPSPVEGFSVVVVEANRCGTPVVASDGVPGDIAVDGYNAFIYSYGDIQASASKMAELINDPLLWRRMSKNASEWSQRFTWEKSVSEFERILKKCVSK